MRFSKFMLLGALFITPFFMSAQSVVGSWLMEGTTESGAKIMNKISFLASGDMTVDFANDGSIEVKATYTQTGDKVSITATSKEDPCSGTVGVYQVTVAGNTCTAKVVNDPCDARRGDGTPMVMTKA